MTMQLQTDHTAELRAALAFSGQSAQFDAQYSPDVIVRYKRARVRAHVLDYAGAETTMLELNAGTGEDAVFFASHGMRVHATDISAGMQEKLREKVVATGLSTMISTELCSYSELESLKFKGPFNYIFSNFAGLNCTGNLQKVLKSCNGLLVPGGLITMVILPKFCLWEILLIFRGKFKTATRRLFSRNGRKAKIEEDKFTCWYYSPKYVISVLGDGYELAGLEGLCSIVPPSYIENFAPKFPKSFSILSRIENKYKDKLPWKYIGDYYIISLRKK